MGKANNSCRFFFFFGYRGIVHPPSNDEGTERTWFEPEQRPRKRVPNRTVHGKQSPRGASKTFWRQDDQPWWQGRSGHNTRMCVTVQGKKTGNCDPVSAHAGNMHLGNWHSASAAHAEIMHLGNWHSALAG